MLVTFAMALATFSTHATVSLTLHGDDFTRSATVERRSDGGVAYVPLGDMVRQFGGGSRLTGERVQVDLAGQSAVAGVNSREVTASQSAYSLRHPVLLIGDSAYISLEDVIPFFERGFPVRVTQAAALADPFEPPAVDENALDALPPPISAPPPAPPADPEPGPAPPMLDPMAPAITVPDRAEASLRMARVRTIVLDPGHGGFDTGHVGARGLVEKDLALTLAEKVRDRVEARSQVSVHLTRTDDEDLSINERTRIASQRQGELLISLHAGASFSPQANGVAIYYQPSQRELTAHLGRGVRTQAARDGQSDYASESALLAEHLSRALTEGFQRPLFGVHAAPLRLFAQAGMPGVLVEVGFLTNAEEEQRLLDSAHQDRLADAIAAGILAAVER